MKVLVTGGAGFIGSHIVDQLLEAGHEPIVVDNLITGNERFLHGKVSFYRVDIRDEQVEDVFRQERPVAVIHQAAQSSVPVSVDEPVHDAEININGTIRLLEASRKFGVEKFIYASSAAVYGNPCYLPIDEAHPTQPLSPYGISKFTPEYYIKAFQELYGLSYTIFRYANVYGQRQMSTGEGAVIAIFLDRLLRGLPLRIDGDGEQTRDYIHVTDIAAANVSALTRADNQTLNIGTGISTSINKLVQLLGQLSNEPVTVSYGPPRAGDIKHSYFDIRAARQHLDFKPRIPLEQGLRQTADYLLQIKGI
ncbi:NAD-dependent epimerase/dehydratase family protein [Desmospora profundinema]|uniref:UDP-glucose 4-epimerase n=1 Tax=Desmospora profundinema TaxID=1571184 RepID=A0ABU1IL96_9BACL|nr:NAD-dependent epimerase/dehydratase family protein [Desmospora profundinema]MDR6225555.1 UDP-glucose 4-epimerase [Desmospora profundinema]